MRARLIVATVVALGLALAVGGTMAFAGKPAPDSSKYPDLRTVVPTHLNLVNQQQNEYLRLSNGIALWIFMLGMAGFPLTGGMFGKLFVFSAAYDAGDWWLVLLGVAATAVSLGYYLNVVRWLYMRSGAELRLAPAGGSPPRDSALSVAIAAAVVVTVGSFFVVQPILDVASDAAASLPF